jgi:hypothetical protein
MPGGEPAPARGGAGVARGLTLISGAAAALTAVVLAAGLSGCSNSDGQGLARQACSHVDRSLSIFREAQQRPGTAKAASEDAAALAQLRAALPIAASAAGEDAQWQALMTTLSDSTRLPESELAHALEAQCAVAGGSGVEPPLPPTTTTS